MLAYQQAWDGQPVWDDDAHMTRPELRSLEGLRRIWLQPGATQQYYPLSHSFFWVAHRHWGDSPRAYHLANILLHAVSALFLFKILRKLAIPGAYLASIIFALHPVHVESVAWISELKNTLSAALYLGSALAYLEFDRGRKASFYGIALSLFVLALMAKSVVATLPAALLLVLWWKRGSLSWRRDVIPLVPFFLAGVIAGLFTAWVEKELIGAKGPEFSISFLGRILIAGRAFWFYLEKLLWPANLIFVYPRWSVSESVWWQYLFPAAALLLLMALWFWRRRGALVGLLFFTVTLLPALGFFNVYPFRFSYVADHFQYLASIGPIVLAATGVTAALNSLGKRRLVLESSIGALLILTLGVLTWRQGAMYSDNETLFRTTIARNPECWMAYNNLGVTRLREGQVGEAIAHFREALKIRPNYADAHNNLGNALLQQGQVSESIPHFRRAIEIEHNNADAFSNMGNALQSKGRLAEAIIYYRKALETKPNKADTHSNLGNAFLLSGNIDAAIAHFKKALEINPDYADSHNNLGNAFLHKGQVDEAIAEYQSALETKTEFSEAHYNLGNAFMRKGQVDDAVVQYQRALAIKPEVSEAHGNLGSALLQDGQAEKAIAHFRTALKINPSNLAAQNNLALVLATSPVSSLRNAAESVALARQANDRSGGVQPNVLRTLAAAYAEARRFTDAVETAQRALELAKERGNARLRNTIESELKLYRTDTPLRIASLTRASHGQRSELIISAKPTVVISVPDDPESAIKTAAEAGQTGATVEQETN